MNLWKLCLGSFLELQEFIMTVKADCVVEVVFLLSGLVKPTSLSLFIVKVTYFNVLSNSFTILMGSSISGLKVAVPVNLSETNVVIVSVLWNGKFSPSKTSCSTSFHVSWSSYSYRWFLHKFFYFITTFCNYWRTQGKRPATLNSFVSSGRRHFIVDHLNIRIVSWLLIESDEKLETSGHHKMIIGTGNNPEIKKKCCKKTE